IGIGGKISARFLRVDGQDGPKAGAAVIGTVGAAAVVGRLLEEYVAVLVVVFAMAGFNDFLADGPVLVGEAGVDLVIVWHGADDLEIRGLARTHGETVILEVES